MIDPSAQVHRLALVENSSIGAGTKVWQFASVIRNAKVGSGCNIASCAIVDSSEIGDNSIISHGAFIDPGMKIGSGVFIGPHVIFCNDFWPRVSKRDFDMEAILNGELAVSAVLDGASIGARAVILPGLCIGRNAMVAAGAIVDRDVPDDHLYRRDNVIIPINPTKVPTRLRAVFRDMPAAAE